MKLSDFAEKYSNCCVKRSGKYDDIFVFILTFNYFALKGGVVFDDFAGEVANLELANLEVPFKEDSLKELFAIYFNSVRSNKPPVCVLGAMNLEMCKILSSFQTSERERCRLGMLGLLLSKSYGVYQSASGGVFGSMLDIWCLAMDFASLDINALINDLFSLISGCCKEGEKI